MASCKSETISLGGNNVGKARRKWTFWIIPILQIQTRENSNRTLLPTNTSCLVSLFYYHTPYRLPTSTTYKSRNIAWPLICADVEVYVIGGNLWSTIVVGTVWDANCRTKLTKDSRRTFDWNLYLFYYTATLKHTFSPKCMPKMPPRWSKSDEHPGLRPQGLS